MFFLESIDSSSSMTVPKGPPILPKLATLVNDRFKTELETGQRKQIKAKYMVPENCTEIFWPPVNEHIWNPLKPDAKGVDRALVAMQDTPAVASGAIATSLNALLLSRDNTKPLEHKAIATRLIDVISLLGSICKELSYRRKEALRPYLTADFKYACNRSTKHEKFLFGNDISKTIHEIKTMGKIVQNSPQRARGVSQFRASAKCTKETLWSVFFITAGEDRTSSQTAPRSLQLSPANQKETMAQLEQVNDMVTKFSSFVDMPLSTSESKTFYRRANQILFSSLAENYLR